MAKREGDESREAEARQPESESLAELRAALARRDQALADQAAQMHQLISAFASQTKPSEFAMSGLSPADEKRLTSVPKPQRYRAIAGKSEQTSATFTMIVVESKTFPLGRVVRLENYQFPEGHDKPASNGGLVPDGHPIRDPGGRNGFHVLYLQWRWETFQQADLRSLVGRSVDSRNCVNPNDPREVPWEESTVFRMTEEAAE